jgi:BirA family biotin operon repressor/biotin-[acetyl-CoA-carboxylase] ligase
LFDQKELENHIATSWLGRSFYFIEELSSTNLYAKKIPNKKSLHGELIVADHQTGGRGQYQRKWKSKAGENLTFSLIFEPSNAERLPLLTLSCAMAIEDTLEDFAGISCKIKWPNDILCTNKKLCGILTETVFSGNNLNRVVVGIGININQTEFEGELKEKAVSLRQAAKKDREISREYFLARLLQKIEYRYHMWQQHNPELVKQINQKLEGFGEWRKLQVEGSILQGEYKFLGVNEKGELMVLDENIDVKKFSYEQIRIL